MELVIDNGNVILGDPATVTENLASSSALIGSGTFSGWNSEIGILPKFDKMEIDYRAFDAGLLPTQIRAVIREDNASGTILADVTITVASTGVGLERAVFNLPAPVEYSGILFLQVNSNGRLGVVGKNAPIPWTQVVVSTYSTNANPNIIGAGVDTAGLGSRLWRVFVSDSGSTIQKNISVACAGETPTIRRGWNEREVQVVFSNGKTVGILIDNLTYNGTTATDHASAISLLNQAFADA